MPSDTEISSVSGCGLTRDQILELVSKVNYNHDTILRGETINYRLSAVEDKVGKLCSRITTGLWWIITALFISVTVLITAVWHIVTWIQTLIEHAVLVT